MNDPTVARDKRIELLRRACDNHQKLYRDAMNGKGIDRHLFGLYVVCKGLSYVCAHIRVFYLKEICVMITGISFIMVKLVIKTTLGYQQNVVLIFICGFNNMESIPWGPGKVVFTIKWSLYTGSLYRRFHFTLGYVKYTSICM